MRPGLWGAGRGFCPGSSARRKGSGSRCHPSRHLPPRSPPPPGLPRPWAPQLHLTPALPPFRTHLPPQLGSHRAGRGSVKGQGWRLRWGTQARCAQATTRHLGRGGLSKSRLRRETPPGQQEAQETQGCWCVGNGGCWCCEGLLPTPTQPSFLVCTHLGHQAQERPQDETLPTPAPDPSLFPRETPPPQPEGLSSCSGKPQLLPLGSESSVCSASDKGREAILCSQKCFRGSHTASPGWERPLTLPLLRSGLSRCEARPLPKRTERPLGGIGREPALAELGASPSQPQS